MRRLSVMPGEEDRLSMMTFDIIRVGPSSPCGIDENWMPWTKEKKKRVLTAPAAAAQLVKL